MSLECPDDDGLPEYNFNGMEYQPNKDKLKAELEKLTKKLNTPKSGKPPVVKNDKKPTPATVGVEPVKKVDVKTPAGFYKRAWDKAMKTLPEWQRKEVDFLFKTGDTENRHYLHFIQLVASIAEEDESSEVASSVSECDGHIA